MKAILFIFSILIIGSSCRKTKDVLVPIHDTTYIVLKPTLVGTWSNGQPTYKNPTFTKDLLSWSTDPPHNYIASVDSIYAVYPDKKIFTEYGYKISPTNDTLTLYRLGAVNASEPVIVYERIN